jgi:folate-binding protein YgfZ
MLSAQEQNSIATLRERGGYFSASEYGLLEIYGKDAARFLQSQTTNDVNALNACCGQLSCLLDRKAHVKAFFQLYRRHESFRIIAERNQISTILSHLEEYRFADKIELLDLTETGQFFAIQGPDAPLLVRQGQRNNKLNGACDHDLTDATFWETPVHVFRKSVTGEAGYFFWVAKSRLPDFTDRAQKACAELGFVQLNEQALTTARLETGLPKYGVDFNDQNLLPETALDEIAASYTKGCFLGQEVLARVRTQGAPTRAIVGLLFAPETKLDFAVDAKVSCDGSEIATIKSNAYSPILQRTIALASIKRDWRIVGKSFNCLIDGHQCQVTVATLPFYTAESITQRASTLYEKAIKLYAQEADTEVESEAVKLLRTAIDLDPSLEGAYEALGVILSKRGKLDEAIDLMKKLAAINEDSVMAHTNLSVFYVERGLKDEAEDEKAISMSIRMRLAAQQATAEKSKEESAQQKELETRERMGMFKQVLDIDQEDLLANYGYGSCLVELGQFSQAVPFLLKAIEIKPMHTVAYVSLAKAYRGLNDKDKLQDALEKGIEVASKRGDLMPLKDLEKIKFESAQT